MKDSVKLKTAVVRIEEAMGKLQAAVRLAKGAGYDYNLDSLLATLEDDLMHLSVEADYKEEKGL